MKLNEARQLALRLMREHGLRGEKWDRDLDGREWTFEFDRAKKRFGQCDYDRRVISQSAHLAELNDEHTCAQNVLHEIAHALAGSQAGHGPVWQRIARSIGDDGARCYGRTVKTPAPKYQPVCWRCDSLGRGKRHRPKHKRSKHACKPCLENAMREAGHYTFRAWMKADPDDYAAAFKLYTFDYVLNPEWNGARTIADVGR